MNYEPRYTESDENISKENHIKNFLALTLGAVAGIIVLVFVLQILVNFVVKFIPEETEHRIFSSKIPAEKLTQKDKNLQILVDKIKPCADIKYDLQIHIEDNKIPNAYAKIGGDVVVTSELFSHIKSENGLVFILAHELSHFKNRDHLRGTAVNLVFGVISASLGESNALLNLIQNLGFSKYSQDQESAADKSALEVLNCYYGHVGGADEFFVSMAKDGDENMISSLFSSHPKLQKRIEMIQNSNFQTGETKKLDLEFKK